MDVEEDTISTTPVESSKSSKSINCKLGILSRPDGSAFLCQGETAIMAGVYGPIETRQLKLLIDKANVETHFRPKAGLPAIGDRFYEHIVKNICETALVAALYPRSAILVVIQEMQNSGGLISCSVNASCLALLNSGIDMKFLIAGMDCVLDKDNILHVDPSSLEYAHAKATFEFVFESNNHKIIALHTTGSFSEDIYEEALQKCRRASSRIFAFYKKVMLDNYEQ